MQDGDASIEAQLRASRARLLLNADAERRAIERVLHDGIQQELVAIAVKLQLARRLPDSEPLAAQGLLDEIEQEERDVLGEMAEGKNNAAIAQSLFLTEPSVEKVIHSIFLKLGISWEPTVHKRVKAVILYLAETD